MRFSIIIVLFFLTTLSGIAQSDSLPPISFHPDLDPSTKLSMCIDTIGRYLYRDNKIVDQTIEIADLIIAENSEIPNSLLMEFAIEKTFFAIDINDLILSYKIIKENEGLLDDESISSKKKRRFNYVNGFTHMAIGDLATAQNIYYELAMQSEAEKDTSLYISSLYSLGQLYTQEEDYESAIKNFLQILELNETFEDTSTSIALLSYELAFTYVEARQYEKGLDVIEAGLTLLENEDIDRLKHDFLLLKGKISLNQNDPASARKFYEVAAPLALQRESSIYEYDLDLFHARLLALEGDYYSSLSIYDAMFVNQDSNNFETKYEILDYAHKVAFKLGDHTKAYQYATLQNEVNKKIQAKKKKQETAYLKIKFESEQKESENQKLAVSILAEQNQNRLLYFTSCAFLLGLLILIIAYFQKKQYSQKLQEEVRKQTHDLETTNQRLNKTNKELFQFSHICSHDLKEPIITIKNFLSLIEKENTTQKNTQHFQYVNQNLTRLSNLLEQIRIYFDINDDEKLVFEKINIHEIHELIEEELLEAINKKNAVVTIENELATPFINCSKIGLTIVLKTLINNAIRFNNSEKPHVTIRYTQKNNQLLISVEDNGIGIQEQYFDYIFEPFKTLESRHIHNSAGLGLSICKKIIIALGGDISVSSEIDKGSTFRISLHMSAANNEKFNKSEVNEMVLLE